MSDDEADAVGARLADEYAAEFEECVRGPQSYALIAHVDHSR